MSSHNNHFSKITAASLLVTLGIIYGDIGTSPLYVLKEIVGENPINKEYVLGAVSCIFWTLTLQTTFKYVIITLRADNKGEGGIFSLYALVRRTKKRWLVIPAIIGGSTLLADGMITPPISVSSAVEGLRIFNPEIPTIPITISIIVMLFFIQQFGTKIVGKLFGPMMLIWFGMLAILGVSHLSDSINILNALNPYYAYSVISSHPHTLLLLGAVFLCTTGAEALYSDMGHCGKKNIRITWIFVKSALILNYFGQGAWLISHEGQLLSEFKGGNPFFSIMPDWFVMYGVAIATSAAIIASQAMISGSFTLINEAIRLNFWPKVKIVYPTETKGQLYIPSINWLLMIGCIVIVLIFKESTYMSAAYGLAIVVTMMMTTSLLNYYMILKRYNQIFISSFVVLYAIIEVAFFAANMGKFTHGGYVTMIIGFILFSIMWVWYEARKIKNRYVEFVPIADYLNLFKDLSNDQTIPKYATHLVYLTSADRKDEIESKIIYSILQRQPKRADIYWFLHVDVVDEPYKCEYKVNHMVQDDVIRIDFKLGFRIAPRINLMFRKVVQDMVANKEVDIRSRYESLNKNNVIGDFRFVVIEKFLSNENELPFYEKVIMKIYFLLKFMSLSEEKAFGLDTSSVLVEKFPMVIAPAKELNMTRVN
jgi:KUP system potassium uptake protein